MRDIILKSPLKEIFNVLPSEFKEVDTYFQPIVNLETLNVVGYEALTRPKKGTIYELFRQAKTLGILSEFDLFCRITAIKNAYLRGIPNGCYLFLNIHPGILSKEPYPSGITLSVLKELGLSPEIIVLEITEFEKPMDENMYLKTVFYFLEKGYKVAIDDYGAGCISTLHLLKIRPSFIKIARDFVQNLPKNNWAKKFFLYTKELAEEIESIVIAEGIENLREYEMVKKIGILLGQGYLFGKPALNFTLNKGGVYESAHLGVSIIYF